MLELLQSGQSQRRFQNVSYRQNFYYGLTLPCWYDPARLSALEQRSMEWVAKLSSKSDTDALSYEPMKAPQMKHWKRPPALCWLRANFYRHTELPYLKGVKGSAEEQQSKQQEYPLIVTVKQGFLEGWKQGHNVQQADNKVQLK